MKVIAGVRHREPDLAIRPGPGRDPEHALTTLGPARRRELRRADHLELRRRLAWKVPQRGEFWHRQQQAAAEREPSQPDSPLEAVDEQIHRTQADRVLAGENSEARADRPDELPGGLPMSGGRADAENAVEPEALRLRLHRGAPLFVGLTRTQYPGLVEQRGLDPPVIPQPLGAPVHLPLPTIGPRPNEKLHPDRRTGGDPRQGPEDVRERLARKRRANGEVIPSRELGPRRPPGRAAGPRLGHEGEDDAGIGRPEERLDERPLPRRNPHLQADLSAAADKLEGDPRLSGQQSLQRRTEQTVQAPEELP